MLLMDDQIYREEQTLYTFATMVDCLGHYSNFSR